MGQARRYKGLSLTEVLLAAGILVLGFLLIAGTFPVGIKLTSVAAERTIGLTAAKEAIGKIKLYGIDPGRMVPNVMVEYGPGVVDPNGITPFWRRAKGLGASDVEAWQAIEAHLNDLRVYPSVATWQVEDYVGPQAPGRRQRKLMEPDGAGARYFWTALCRRMRIGGGAGRDVQVTVFVGRKAGAAGTYPRYDPRLAQGPWTRSDRPMPVPITVKWGPTYEAMYKDDPDFAGAWVDEIQVDPKEYDPDSASGKDPLILLGGYFKEGAQIVDSRRGMILRVDRVRVDEGIRLAVIRLLPPADAGVGTRFVPGRFEVGQFEQTTGGSREVWVMPPAMQDAGFDAEGDGEEVPPMVSGRYPGVGVYQWVVSF